MARCTAPSQGHRTASGRADCPACGGSYSRYGGYSDYGQARTPLTPRQGAAPVGRVAAEGRAGRELVHPWCTRLRKCERSRRSAKVSRSEHPCPIFGMFFSATRGTIGQSPPRNYTIYSSHSVSRSGSAKRMSSSARHYSVKLTRGWQSRESELCL